MQLTYAHEQQAFEGTPKVAPVVSVIIPTHNRAQLLVRAIRSVLAQTYRRLEIVVVDDASDDETSDVIRRFGDGRIRYIRHDSPKGGAAARNSGIEAATGEYIAFLDDDDEWEPSKTESQLEVLASCDVVLCMSTSSVEQDVRELTEIGVCNLEQLRRGMPRIGGGVSAIMGRADVFKSVMFDEHLPRCQDWDLLIRLATHYRIQYFAKRLVRYNDGQHIRISNALAKSNGQKQTEVAEKWLHFFDKHRAFFGERLYRRHVINALLYGIRGRSDKIKYLRDMASRLGYMPVATALMQRLYSNIVSTGSR